MKKILFTMIFSLIFCGTAAAESYYFKGCKLSEKATGNYVIDLEKNVIIVTLKGSDGAIQKFTDNIKLITDDRIVSEIIQQTNKQFSTQYYLDANLKAVVRQIYKKEIGIDLIRPEGPKRKSDCATVKADWKEHKNKKRKIEIKKKEDKPLPLCKGSNIKKWSNCQGSYKAENGTKYSGEFKSGKIIKGKATYPKKGQYVGNFKDNKPHGQGTFNYSDGSKYYGDWKLGKNQGRGIKTWQNGKKYTGEFKENKLHGKGTFSYPDGSKYAGEYKNGKRHGEGQLTYANGSSYLGEFVDGHEHGKGICFKTDGSSDECIKDISSTGRDTHNIFFRSKKWVKMSEYENTSGKGKKIMDKLTNSLNEESLKICSQTENFDILKDEIIILELDETPAFGIETVVKLGIDGVIECK